MIKLKEKYNIVIIDTGVDWTHPLLKNKKIDGFRAIVKDGTLSIEEDYKDEYGHGTAIYTIISKEVPDARILNIKVLDQDDGRFSCEQLVCVLQYIYDNIDCDIINMSLGVKSLKNNKLYEVCNQLMMKNIILVAAFDNEGCISYPAAFDCVIGVETSLSACSLEYIDNSIVNVRGRGLRQKLPWVNPRYVLFGGNSIACAHVTSSIYNLVSGEKIDFKSLLNKIKDVATVKKENRFQNKGVYPSDRFEMVNVALFPFNKEMHALIRFRKTLPINIISVHDIKYSGNIGASTDRLIGIEMQEKSLYIKEIEYIPWHEIDTLVLGHCEEINRLIGEDIRYKLITQAILHNVNIYSYDPLNMYPQLKKYQNIHIFWPQLCQCDVPIMNLNKLYHIDKPVISIMGTSSRQGKFTLQNNIKNLFVKNGYKVGCISTEPNGYLLGMDAVFPLGYQAYINVTEHQKIQIINQMEHRLCKTNDVILAAGQANSIPFTSYLVETFPVKQHSFLMGLQSDLIILCVNPFDGIEYIRNTIQYLEGTSRCEVCALVLFPMNYFNDWRGTYGAKKRMDSKRIEEHCSVLEKQLARACYLLDDNESISELYLHIINLLTEEK